MRLHVVRIAINELRALRVQVADLEEDEGVDEREEDRRTEAREERALVAQNVLRLPGRELQSLHAEALTLGHRRHLDVVGDLRQGALLRTCPAVHNPADLRLVVRLNGEDDEVGRVVVRGAIHLQVREVAANLTRGAMIGHLAADQKDRLVKELEDLGARLVDRAEYRAVHVGELLQQADDIEGGACVQAARRLVEKRDLRIRDQLRAHGRALALAAGDAFDKLVPHHGVGASCETHGPEKVRDQALFAMPGGVAETEVRGELQDLPRRHGAEERVVLHDVAEELLVLGGLDRFPVHLYLARNLGLRPATLAHAPGEDVEQARLPGPRWAQDAGQLARAQVASHALEDLLPALLRLHREAEALPSQGR
mmetsp:Transcript_75172/g.218264  ORF Transcript_75172/g.218264 Transcript_75172/m.218264 type:complete len:368 (+) Transcript_75172:84-1187(+)